MATFGRIDFRAMVELFFEVFELAVSAVAFNATR